MLRYKILMVKRNITWVRVEVYTDLDREDTLSYLGSN